ncbi:MAG: CopD family protein [Xanthomonadaceae bacterium]|nr:CopD family protein [Xanthomonadaceae bacterium]
MHPYILTKTFHLLFVIAWMAAVFYLPRILINLREAGDQPEVRARLVLMGRRLYRFGHIMLGFAVLLGLALWMYFKMGWGGDQYWVHAKLLLVVLIITHYCVSGYWLKGVDKGRSLPSGRMLCWFNEVPVFLLLAIIWLVLGKPF